MLLTGRETIRDVILFPALKDAPKRIVRRGRAVRLVGAAVGLLLGLAVTLIYLDSLRSVASPDGRLSGDLEPVIEDVFGPMIERAR